MQKHRIALSLAAITAAVALAGCGQEAAVASEIKIPILQTSEQSYQTVTAELMDLENEISIPATLGYPYEDKLSSAAEGNLISYELKVGQTLKAGDVIAVIDSSSLDFELNSQKINTDAAYSTYTANPSERNRLLYEEQNYKLEAMKYEVEQYTLRAPYDCIVTDVSRPTVGDVIEKGAYFCTIANPDDIYVYCDKSADTFKLGMKLRVKNNNLFYNATVVMSPEQAPNTRSSNASRAIIKFDEGELEKLLADTPNAVGAGWATVYVVTERWNDVLAVPDSAIKSSSDSSYVNLMSNGTRIQLPVEVASSCGGYSVIQSGLSVGDTVTV